MQLRVPPSSPFGCVPSTITADGPFALLALRGGCNFTTKAQLALQAGATALIVANSLTGLYQSRGGLWNISACDVDCSACSAYVPVRACHCAAM